MLVKNRIFTAVSVFFVFLLFLFSRVVINAAAGNPSADGSLRIEPLSAFNFIIDSNVLTPSTYAPKSATLGAKICNDGAVNITNTSIYIGNYNGGVGSIPGTYPVRTTSDPDWSIHTQLSAVNGGAGSYSLTHEGGSAGLSDATRYIGTIKAGECKVEYWIVSYPRTSINGTKSVAGREGPEDDLFLYYDLWAKGIKSGNPISADVRRRVNFRNEISAAANKIWPNTTSKVPAEYLNMIGETLGWNTFDPGGGGGLPGTFYRTQGIWYDFGNVGAGFDNDGDMSPDRNAWVQPVGDPASFDSGCFRLVRTYGLLVIKRNTGDILMPFENQLYFSNIPADNTGVVGLVYYEYVSLDGICGGTLTPYQEVASGYDNEKFNGDYGYSIAFTSANPQVTLEKIVDAATVPSLPHNLTYTMNFANTGSVSVGQLALNMPLVVHDTIPTGTEYIAGSAAINNHLPAGVTSYAIQFSTDHGVSWTSSEPGVANQVTDVEWWLSDSLSPGSSGSVSFQVTVPSSNTGALVDNTAHLQFGSGGSFAEDDAITLLPGLNTINGKVYQDNGAGGGVLGDKTINGAEAGINIVTVNLYLDSDGNGTGDILISTKESNATGDYSFTSLPDGNYVVVVNDLDADLTTGRTGWTNTNDIEQTVNLDSAHASGTGVTVSNINFGFAPVLTLTKTLQTASPAEGSNVTYKLSVKNSLPSGGVGGICIYSVYGSQIDVTNTGTSNSNSWDNYGSLAALDGHYARAKLSNATDYAAVTGYPLGTYPGTIEKVEVLLPMIITGTLGANDSFEIASYIAGAVVGAPTTYVGTNAIFTASGLKTIDITNHKASWTFADLNGTNFSIRMDAKHTGGTTGDIAVDAVAIRVTTDQTNCESDSTVLSRIPLTDTFDASVFDFVEATPAKSKLTTGVSAHGYANAGIIRWDNVGPLSAGESVDLFVTLYAKTFTAASVSTTNYADITRAYFANNKPANDVSASAGTTLTGKGSIAGVIFSNNTSTGWSGTTGYNLSDPDYLIPNATVNLYACLNGTTYLYSTVTANNKTCGPGGGTWGGTWTLVGTQATGTDGAYLFTGLSQGFYYVEVAGSSLPSGATQNLEASVAAGGAGGGTVTAGANANSYWSTNTPSSTNLDKLGTNWNPIDTATEDITKVNFGYTINPLIYGTVWQDMDGDGTRDSGDNGIQANSVVQLRDCGVDGTCGDGGESTVTTNTSSAGYYSFNSGCAVGHKCLLTVLTPALPNAGTTTWTETFESDASLSNGIQFDLSSGEIEGSHDFGFTHSSTLKIGDQVYYDWNQNGVQEASEQEGIPGLTVYLYEDANGDGLITNGIDAIINSMVTLSDGAYMFDELASGNYLVILDESALPSGTFQSGDPDEAGGCMVCDARAKVALTTNDVLSADFGYHPQGVYTFGDTVWKDVNGNGVQSGVQEIGVPYITVWLAADLNNDGAWTNAFTVTTDLNGQYLFDGLPAGTYKAIVDTTDSDLPKDGFGFVYVPSTTTEISHILDGSNADSTNYLAADFGFKGLGALGDTVYWDANGNGSQDASEPGITGIVVTLGGAGSDTTTTDSNGRYMFSGLTAGNYTVTVGAISGNPLQTADPDRDGETCLSTAYPSMPACDRASSAPIVAGSNLTGLDFGFQPTGVIGDRVWYDTDGQSDQDPGELGVGAVKITLKANQTVYVNGTSYAAGDAITVYTDPDGLWTLSRVFASSGTALFTAELTLPTGSYGVTWPPDATADQITTFKVDDTGVVTEFAGITCTNCNTAIDFGIRLVGSNALSGTVCRDEAIPNGFCGSGTAGTSPSGVAAGEIAYSNLPVYLYMFLTDNGSDNIVGTGDVVRLIMTDSTDLNGDYSFVNIPTGKVIVSIGAPLQNGILTTEYPIDLPSAVNLQSKADFLGYTTGAYEVYNFADGQTKDFADFAFTTNTTYDLGDLPNDVYGITSVSSGGAQHITPASGAIKLGAEISLESEAAGTVGANSDTKDDAVTLVSQKWGNSTTINDALTVDINGAGWLVGWIDFNNDGDFTEAGEMIINEAVSSGNDQPFSVTVPSGVFDDITTKYLYARFRLFASEPAFPASSYMGTVTNGEVEDYRFSFAPTAVSLTTLIARSSSPWRLASIMAVLVGIMGSLLLWRRNR